MHVFGDIVIKSETGFVQCCGCGSIVFLTASTAATIICIHTKTKNLFSGNKSFLFHCICSVTLL